MAKENMSKLEELIEQYCPDGVEWKTLENVCQKVFAGGTPTSSNSSYYGGDIPWLRSGEVNFNEINSTEKTITEEGYKSSSAKWIERHSVLIAMTGATVARSAMTMIDLTANQSVCALTPDRSILSYRYLYYWISRSYLQLKGMAQGALTSLNLNIIKALEIPVPPLPVQEEIVRVLDTFTELQAELQAELQKRKQQYNYYCNKLLNHFPENNDVTEYFVGQLASFSYGYTSKAEDNGPIRYIRITDINEKGFLNPDNAKFIPYSQDVKPYILNKNDIVMARTGATFGKTLLFNEDYPAAYASFLIKISLSDKVNPRYYWHFSKSSKYWEQANRLVGGGAQPQFNTKAISQIKIMLPPLEEQNRIVSILDRFDTLTNDLTSGLPAEMEKRRQQYEFYRDKLLTFKRKEA